MWHSTPNRQQKRLWNKKERRVQNQMLIRHRDDYDKMTIPPERKISDLWDWY